MMALTYWRFVVRPSAVSNMAEYLRMELKNRGCVQQTAISDEVMSALIQEAFRRAADREKDKLARYGPMYEEIEFVGKEVDAAFDGKPDVDPRIRTILEFHQLT